MSGGTTWVYIWFLVGTIWALFIIFADNSEVSKEKATAILCVSLLPFIAMMCGLHGGMSLLDIFAIAYLVIKLKGSLMIIWEYYDPAPR